MKKSEDEIKIEILTAVKKLNKHRKELSLVSEINHDISEGIPLTQTARRLNIDWHVLHRICGRNNLAYIRSPTKNTGTTDAEILGLKALGMPDADIAKKIGTSRQNVHSRFKKIASLKVIDGHGNPW